MIDLGEFAMVAVQHNDRDPRLKPRFDFEEAFLDKPDGIRWADAGVVDFPDDVARAAVDAGVPDGDNAMRRFLQAFADPTNPTTGEADLLYLHTHGSPTGSIFDHISDIEPGSTNRALVLNPFRHLAEDGRWNSDADWFISEACAMLFGGLEGPAPGPGGPQVGALNWREVLRSSPRPPHGILGFAFGKTANRVVAQDFLSELELGLGYVESWKAANEEADPPMPWAALYYASTSGDTVREIAQHPLPGDRMRYESFVGVPEGLCIDAVACCTGETPVAEIGTGLWIKAGLSAQTVPAEVPAAVQGRVVDLLQPLGELAGLVKRSGEREALWGSRERRLLTVPGADNDDEARRQAESLLTTCGVGPDRLRWSFTGHALQQDIVGDVLSEPTVTARVVRYELMSHGLPVSGSAVTVNVTPEGITRVGVQRVPMPVGPVGDKRVRPIGLDDALKRHWSGLDPSQARTRVVLAARLCWKMDSGGMAVPAWEVQWAPADPGGMPMGVPETLWLDAAQGRLMEVSK
jgi:hypothetical protein